MAQKTALQDIYGAKKLNRQGKMENNGNTIKDVILADERFGRLADIILEWNEKINVTAVREKRNAATPGCLRMSQNSRHTAANSSAPSIPNTQKCSALSSMRRPMPRTSTGFASVIWHITSR